MLRIDSEDIDFNVLLNCDDSSYRLINMILEAKAKTLTALEFSNYLILKFNSLKNTEDRILFIQSIPMSEETAIEAHEGFHNFIANSEYAESVRIRQSLLDLLWNNKKSKWTLTRMQDMYEDENVEYLKTFIGNLIKENE